MLEHNAAARRVLDRNHVYFHDALGFARVVGRPNHHSSLLYFWFDGSGRLLDIFLGPHGVSSLSSLEKTS